MSDELQHLIATHQERQRIINLIRANAALDVDRGEAVNEYREDLIAMIEREQE